VKEVVTESAVSTFDLGRNLGDLLLPGDFIALIGELGAGKTQFVKGLALGLGIPSEEPVNSPSYTILNIYQGRIPLYHFDLYRLSDENEIAELGFDEYFTGTGASIVEWADRLGIHYPCDNLKVVFSVEGADRRRLTFQATGCRSEELLRRLSRFLL